MYIKRRLILLLLPLLTLLFPLQVVNAATVANTFQITTDGSQQTSPFIHNKMVVYTSLSDIWGYNLKTKQNFQILQKDDLQFTSDFYQNLIIYENSNPDQSTDVFMYNLKTKKDTLVAGGPGSQGSGVTNGRVVAYIDGGACGSLKLYDIRSKTTEQIVSSTCHPIRISGEIIVYPVADPNGTDVGGYDLNEEQAFDITTENNFQESANIFKSKVVWVHYISGGLGDYNSIVVKDLKTEEVRTIYESTTSTLQSPSVSNRYVVWSESSAQHVGGVQAADLKTGEVFEVQAQGPHQNSHTSTDIWRNMAVWMSFRTGNGDIYSSVFERN